MDLVLKTNVSTGRRFSIEDSQQAIAFKKMVTPNFRYIMHQIGSSAGSDTYNDMEYDLSESARIIDSESAVASAFRKKRQLILKNGFEITSTSDRNLEYIKQRLIEFEFVTSLTFREFLVEIVENMVNFNNCFILKHRKEENSSGQLRQLPDGKEFKPIAGLYVLAAPTIDTATNGKSGRIIRYRHRITDDYSKQFRPEDIFHMYENKRVGLTIGTPPLEAVKDDIILLRSIEQDAESMIHRHANPFMHVQVGSDKQPARILQDGTSEVDVYADIIDQMPEEGGVSTPHRVNIKMLGAESQALRLETYLEYFKRRVLNGLCISEVDLGGSAGISGSADVASQSLKEEVRCYQETISNFITNYIFNELLLESPMYASQFMIPEEERVVLKFVESDLDKKIKIESHYLQLFIAGLINKEAAIRHMEWDVTDLAEDEVDTGSSNNKVKNNISNNIIEPKNQHNIKDSLSLDRYSSMTNYYDSSYSIFIENILRVFPEDLILGHEKYLNSVFNRLENIRSTFGLEYVNKYVESAIFKLLAES